MTANLQTPADPAIPTPLKRTDARAIQGAAFGICAELVYQRDDLAAADSPDDERFMELALRALSLTPPDTGLARELIRRALHISRGEGQAVVRAQTRRDHAHGEARGISGACDALIRRGR